MKQKRKQDDWDFQHAINFAKNAFKQRGDIIPTILAFADDDKPMIIACPWKNEAEKPVILTRCKLITHAHNVKHIIFMCETWFAKERFDANGKRIQPKNCPDRQDALLIMSFNHERQRVNLYHVKKRNGKLLLKDVDTADRMEIGKHFLDLLPPRGHTPNPDHVEFLEFLQKKGVLTRQEL